MPTGATKKQRVPFNKRYVKVQDIAKLAVDSDSIKNAYEAGYEAYKRAGKTMSVKECFAGYLQYIV